MWLLGGFFSSERLSAPIYTSLHSFFFFFSPITQLAEPSSLLSAGKTTLNTKIDSNVLDKGQKNNYRQGPDVVRRRLADKPSGSKAKLTTAPLIASYIQTPHNSNSLASARVARCRLQAHLSRRERGLPCFSGCRSHHYSEGAPNMGCTQGLQGHARRHPPGGSYE